MANTPVTSIRLPDDLKDWLSKKARVENRSLANSIITTLRAVKAAEERRKPNSQKFNPNSDSG